MEYRLVVTGAGQTPVDIEGFVDLPMAFRPGTGLDGAAAFDKMFDLFIRDPATSSVADLYRELFEAEMKKLQAQHAWLPSGQSPPPGTGVTSTSSISSPDATPDMRAVG